MTSLDLALFSIGDGPAQGTMAVSVVALAKGEAAANIGRCIESVA